MRNHAAIVKQSKRPALSGGPQSIRCTGSEAEPGPEFTGEGARNDRAVRRDEVRGLEEAGRICGIYRVHIALQISTKIGAVRQVKSLEEHLDVVAVGNGNCLCEPGIELNKGLAAERIIADLLAGAGLETRDICGAAIDTAILTKQGRQSRKVMLRSFGNNCMGAA